MGKTLLIAEKPDQARSFYLPLLEKLSGEKLEKRHGYFESKSYCLTWFFGHLLEMLNPDEYEERYKQWKLEDLPIIPKVMKYRYKNGTKEQGQIIAKLCQECSEIICGTDPDREGQGIFDTFIRFNKINKPMRRLWATSLTEKDLIKSWGKIQGIEKYKNLSTARELRSDSDWLVGMNASRAYSIIWKANLPIGRVLTSTLAIIVKRDMEVESYKEIFYYQLQGKWNGIEFTYFDETGSKFESRGELEKVLSEMKGKPFTLSGLKSEEKMENPPKTFSLPDLQKEANVKLGFSLGKTLETAQALYEKKITTYPRTDSPFLPTSDLHEYQELVRKVATDAELPLLRIAETQPACVKDTDSPHTALIVTGEIAPMNDDEKKLYELIRSRFVCAFMTPRSYKQYDFEIDDGTGKRFKATVRQDKNSGFRNLYIVPEKEDGVQEVKISIDEKNLQNSKQELTNISISESKKAKPKYYTPATLITAMQTCGRTLENEEAKKILAEKKGIGTPATQALYPEQLKKYEYIMEQKGAFISTGKGRKLISEIAPDLKTPEMTAEWELKLELVEKGNLTEEAYRREFYDYILNIVLNAKKRIGKIDFAAGDKTTLSCPGCKKGIVKKQWGYVCEAGCGFSVGHEIAKKTISDNLIETLISDGETPIIKGFKSAKTGNSFDAKLVIKEEGGKKKVTFEFESIECPKCGKPVRIFEKGAGCTDRDKCGFVIWREISQKKLSDEHLKMLINKKKTRLLKGFKTKEGKEFEAELVLDKEYKVRFSK
jgi:DNA topoisomerase III